MVLISCNVVSCCFSFYTIISLRYLHLQIFSLESITLEINSQVLCSAVLCTIFDYIFEPIFERTRKRDIKMKLYRLRLLFLFQMHKILFCYLYNIWNSSEFTEGLILFDKILLLYIFFLFILINGGYN